MNITPDLCIAARNLLRMTRNQLAEQAGIATVTLKVFEDGLRATPATAEKITLAFSAHGVTFTNGRTVQTIKRKLPAD